MRKLPAHISIFFFISVHYSNILQNNVYSRTILLHSINTPSMHHKMAYRFFETVAYI